MSTSLIVGLGVLLIALIFLRMEIAFALGIIGLLWLSIADHSMTIGVSRVFGGMDGFVLLAIPFFLLAGELMNEAKITPRLVQFANVTIGRLRGGLAQANVLASVFFAGITGAAVADVAALGRIFVPAMAEEGYDRDFSAAVTAASSLVGPIIPPSIIIVIYGGVTATSVGGLFAAAIVPGILLGLALMAIVAVLSHKHDYPKYEEEVDRSEYPRLLLDSLLALTMPVIILGGIMGGYMTPTEAAAVACAYAIFLGMVIFRTLNLRSIYRALHDSLMRASQLYLIIGFAMIISWLLAREGVPRMLAEAIGGSGVGVIGFMALVLLILLFIGTWLEIGAATIILAPTLADMATLIGIHEFQFGIMFVVALCFGLITPPVGICLFAASSVSNTPVWPIAKRIVPFFVADLAVIALVIYVPELTLWLPRQFGII
ncbi:TRAP transporter large permease (plasmid) [Haloferacaceae archaeon DSL9]